MGPIWRAMRSTDLDEVAEIAAIGFPDHFEDRGCFENRMGLYPAGCFVLAEPDGPVVGYAVAYPWIEGSVPALNTRIGALPARANVFYLHDLALHPDARGQSATRSIVERIVADAGTAGFPTVALVAVNRAEGFWARHGFVTVPSATVSHYGDDARYMTRATYPGQSRVATII